MLPNHWLHNRGMQVLRRGCSTSVTLWTSIESAHWLTHWFDHCRFTFELSRDGHCRHPKLLPMQPGVHYSNALVDWLILALVCFGSRSGSGRGRIWRSTDGLKWRGRMVRDYSHHSRMHNEEQCSAKLVRSELLWCVSGGHVTLILRWTHILHRRKEAKRKWLQGDGCAIETGDGIHCNNTFHYSSMGRGGHFTPTRSRCTSMYNTSITTTITTTLTNWTCNALLHHSIGLIIETPIYYWWTLPISITNGHPPS